MKSKRYELIILFMLVSWGLARGLFEGLGFLLFPGVTSANDWTLYIIEGYLIYGLFGLSLGLFTWLALRWLDLRPDTRTGVMLTGGFMASWLAGLSLVLFALDPNAGWSWIDGFSITGLFCGLVMGLILRQLVSMSIKRFLGVIFLFAVIFLVTSEFSLKLLTDVDQDLTFELSTEIAMVAQAAVCGMLAMLVILFVTKKVEWISIRWRDLVFALLAFVVSDALALLVFYALGSAPLAPWIFNAIVAAGWAIGIALAAHRPRSIPFYVILFVLGITFGRICWLNFSFRFIYTTGALYNLSMSVMIGLFIVVGMKRLSTILLMFATTILAFWLGNLIPYNYTEYSLVSWLVNFTIATINGLIMMWGMFFWGVMKPVSASDQVSQGKPFTFLTRVR